jgi:type I restriction-modification system DNA methylase subunit
MLVEVHKLDALIKLPAGVFRPYAGVSTAILVFTKTGVGGTDFVWFYDMELMAGRSMTGVSRSSLKTSLVRYRSWNSLTKSMAGTTCLIC